MCATIYNNVVKNSKVFVKCVRWHCIYIYNGKKARLCDLQQQSSMIRFISIITETITHAMQFGNSTIKIVKL